MDVTNDTVEEKERNLCKFLGVETRKNENSWKFKCRLPALVSVEITGMNRFCLFNLTL